MYEDARPDLEVQIEKQMMKMKDKEKTTSYHLKLSSYISLYNLKSITPATL
jgi:hypothetical protein